MTVYVLMLEYGSSYLRGVYSSLELARAAAAIVAKDTGMDKYSIYPITVDSP